MTFFSRAAVSVLLSMPYLSPRASNSLLPSRQSLTDCGIVSPNFLIKSTRLIKSVTDPLAAFSRTVPMKPTIFLAVSSSMHGTIVVGSGSLFYSKSPFNPCWRISLLVKHIVDTNKMAKIANILDINNRLYILLIYINLYIKPIKTNPMLFILYYKNLYFITVTIYIIYI